MDATDLLIQHHEELERGTSLEAESLLRLFFTCYQMLVHPDIFLGSYGLCKSDFFSSYLGVYLKNYLLLLS